MNFKYKRLFDRAWAAAERRQWVYGKLGKVNSDGSTQIVVPDRPNFYYVRIGVGESQTIAIAQSIQKVPARLGLPVKMRVENGIYVLYDVDPVYVAGSTEGQGQNPFGLPDHTHARGTGLDYIVEAQRLEPGLVHWDSEVGGLTVAVEGFRYNVGDGWETFTSDTIDITSSVPVTLDKHRWVLIGVDTSTNTLTTVDGDEEDTSTPLTLDMLDELDVTGLVPLGAIQVSFGNSVLSDYTKFYDARGWLNGGATIFDDAEGNPADVSGSAAADGTSGFAARRDHVHFLPSDIVTTIKILDGNVTYAKIQNVTALRVLGSIAGGVVSEIPVTAYSLTLLDDADAATARTTLGLGSIATETETNYALLAGRAGGQNLHGGNAASETLVLEGTSHATKGKVVFGSAANSAYDEVNDRLGIGTASPGVPVHIYSPVDEALRIDCVSATGSPFISILQNGTRRGYLEFNHTATEIRLANEYGAIAFYTGAAGTETLSATIDASGNLTMANAVYIATDILKARDSGGLRFEDRDGNLAIFLEHSTLHVGFGGLTNPASWIDLVVPAGAQPLARFGQTGVTNGFVISSDGSRFSYVFNTGSVVVPAGTSSGTEAAVGGDLFSGFSSTGNVGTGEDNIATYSVPANALATNGDSVWFEASGTYANNANAKTIRARFGTSGTTLVISLGTDLSSAGVWVIRGRIIRTGAATQRAYGTATQGPSGGKGSVYQDVVTNLDQTLSGAVTLRITGEATSNNDIVCTTLTVGWGSNNT